MGGKSGSSVTIGYWYRVAYHHGLSATPIDAFLEFRAAEKTAWSGELTQSGTFHISASNLFGGEKDQGGIDGDVDVMFGEPTQQPNNYLAGVFGPQPAWLGVTTLAFKGGRFGAMNPYPQPPAYKVRVILKGWDNDVCWYPETAAITVDNNVGEALGPTSAGWRYAIGVGDESYASPTFDDAGWAVGASPFASANVATHPYVAAGGYPAVQGTNWPLNTTMWARRQFYTSTPASFDVEIFVDNYATVWVNGHLVLPRAGSESGASVAAFKHRFTVPASALVQGINTLTVRAEDMGQWSYAAFTVTLPPVGNSTLVAMNPAHILYDALTSQDRGAEPTANIDDASFRAGADWFYAQGIGLCTGFDPDSETVEQFIQRIEKVAGCSVSRSLVDGKWYLDIANGVYDLATLPILTDDDILDFAANPTTLDDVINSIAVEYVDVQQHVTATTPPVQAMGLVEANGVNHDVRQYHELPTPQLAARMAQRDLQTSITPTHAFSLTTTRTPFAWRVNTYFRLQAPKRGIADMVCILAEKSSGTLKSGAMTITAAEDVYTVPAASFVQIEPGVDTRPPQIPVAITAQAVFEAPYITVVRALSRADLAALPADVGYVMTVAQAPGDYPSYELTFSSGADYTDAGAAEWCAFARAQDGDPATGDLATIVILAGAIGLADVAVGSAALWESEIVRVDAVDAAATPPTVTLGRGCADTVPVRHAAGTALWFYDGDVGTSAQEFTDGETIDVKLLTNSGSQQLDPSLATVLPLTFAGRQSRPYPPAKLRINGETWPREVIGAITVTWVDRDRVQQADQLVDNEMAGIGPEAGTTYTVRYILNGTLVHTDPGLTALASSYTPAGAGLMRVEVESVRGDLTSLQMHVREFTLGQPLQAEDGTLITTEDSDLIIMG